MKPIYHYFTRPTPEFRFAGFDWPRNVVRLPAGSLRARLAERKRREAHGPSVGPYYHAPRPLTRNNPQHGQGFYLEDMGAPGLRWAWCDDLPGDWDTGSEMVWPGHGEPFPVRLDPPRIGHRGWFTDDEFHDETIRGLVLKLPKSRGYLAGWSMGERMASEVDATIHDTARDAALVADSMAENAAEREREYQESERERLDAEEMEAEEE